MLEFWYKEKRSLVDFRRGPLGPHFDDFAAYLKAKRYSFDWGKDVLGKCCQFNDFVIEQGIRNCRQLTESHIDAFLALYLANIRSNTSYSPRSTARQALRLLFLYLVEAKAIKPPKTKQKRNSYDWLLQPYLRHLETECELSKSTVERIRTQVGGFLHLLGNKAIRSRFKTVRAETIEHAMNEYLKNRHENLSSLGASLRRFFKYCAEHRHTALDFSGLIPPVRRYRHASLPKGMEDSALERLLREIDTTTSTGARDYALLMLMMAYGLRGISVAALLLDDIDWRHSRIRIRAQKGGKEVLVPLLESVGDAIIRYLRHRPGKTPFREVFLTVHAPVKPLNGHMISHLIRGYMKKAGITLTGMGSRTLRHSWAIRALAHGSPIKAIADVLGHRYIDTTFIYAKADLNSLREVALPWPEKN